MFELPASTVRNAAALLDLGWRPTDVLGQLAPPPISQRCGYHLTDEWTWQAMALMELCAGTVDNAR